MRVRPDGWLLGIARPGRTPKRDRTAGVDSWRARNVILTVPIEPHQKWTVFYNADLVVLSSQTESFGMAVAEALAYGGRVLATTVTP